MNLIIFISSILISASLCFFYKKIWLSSPLHAKTPTGYGITLIFLILFHSYFIENSIPDFLIFFIILFFAIIYWIDDIKYLSSIFRFCIQFICGSLIGYFLLIHYNYENLSTFYILILLSGLLNLFLTNVINFYDGLDLNIVTLTLGLTLVMIYLSYINKYDNYYSLIIAGYIIGFAFFNYFPNNIFFGDSGCYVLASFVCFFIMKAIISHNYINILIVIPLLLPILDVVYVVCLRIYMGETLLSRNYHHLYHKLENKYKSKVYLFPQLFNIASIYLIYKLLFIDLIDLKKIIIFLSLSLLITLINYFSIRFYLINENKL
tara:strand:+ start:513 stop:1472 length:960 start_codon:yes stop_codon:yes gene_type:complete